MERFETRRLKLRPVEAADRVAVMAGVGDLSVSRWLIPVPHPYTDTDFDYFLAEIATPGEVFAVEDADGFCGIVDAGDDVLGYWFAPAAHGRGYATEAARLVLAARFARGEGPCLSGYFADNARSANVLKKLGFVEVGRDERHCRALRQTRAHVVMSATRDTFVAALPLEARSARLTYRSLYPTDAAALHEVVRHWDVTRQLGPSWPWPADPARTAVRAKPFAGVGFAFGVFQADALIGTVAVTGGELGYSLHPDHHRQGLMFEAAQTALARAFGEMALPQVAAAVWADNAASLGLLHKLGFKITGEHTGTTPARPDPTPGFDLILTAADWRGA